MPRTAPLVELEPQEEEALQRVACRPTSELRLSQRAQIILHAATYLQRRLDEPGRSVEQWLADASRPGCPPKFDELFWTDVLVVATSDPEDSQRPITHWSSRELAEEVVQRELTDHIHRSTISRFLAECRLQPHRIKGWMNRPEDPEFEPRAGHVKQLLVQAQQDPCPERVTVSFDEKTGMQAKERIAPDQPVRPGQPARLEFEYARHGTLVLFAMMLVHSGEILARTRPNRTNRVTAAVMVSLFQELLATGYQNIDVVLDQLNTHWSIDLVKAVAELCGLPEPDPSVIREGSQRKAWLEAPNKPIVFHFTPKHASWLNPIEIWFSVLARKLLRRGSFRSTTDLEDKVHRFVEYFNEKLARPYKLKEWRIAA
jgi:hypothetical protein